MASRGTTGGFREFLLLPFVHRNAPVYLARVARPGPANRAVHAVGSAAASRADR
jgi:FO synthase